MQVLNQAYLLQWLRGLTDQPALWLDIEGECARKTITPTHPHGGAPYNVRLGYFAMVDIAGQNTFCFVYDYLCDDSSGEQVAPVPSACAVATQMNLTT